MCKYASSLYCQCISENCKNFCVDAVHTYSSNKGTKKERKKERGGERGWVGVKANTQHAV